MITLHEVDKYKNISLWDTDKFKEKIHVNFPVLLFRHGNYIADQFDSTLPENITVEHSSDNVILKFSLYEELKNELVPGIDTVLFYDVLYDAYDPFSTVSSILSDEFGPQSSIEGPTGVILSLSSEISKLITEFTSADSEIEIDWKMKNILLKYKKDKLVFSDREYIRSLIFDYFSELKNFLSNKGIDLEDDYYTKEDDILSTAGILALFSGEEYEELRVLNLKYIDTILKANKENSMAIITVKHFHRASKEFSKRLLELIKNTHYSHIVYLDYANKSYIFTRSGVYECYGKLEGWEFGSDDFYTVMDVISNKGCLFRTIEIPSTATDIEFIKSLV